MMVEIMVTLLLLMMTVTLPEGSSSQPCLPQYVRQREPSHGPGYDSASHLSTDSQKSAEGKRMVEQAKQRSKQSHRISVTACSCLLAEICFPTANNKIMLFVRLMKCKLKLDAH